ncbi:SDR family NAD(P)-dependent oxidoreductase [Microbacterium sp.]|jgi:NAD(P)-dependent dehydrogenase (short-subunit alcohol dehydrogenase family)|uniref:SDR family NAD(P)-dependent oxidoreductase n=1 Tax=Microbacterium sp. TaxID=51671 RepID=UPI0037C60D86
MSTEENWETPVSDPLASAQAPWLEGKVALVAGGGLSGPLGGVGFALAWLYARNGAAIAVVDRDEAAAARTVEAIRSAGGQAEAFLADLTDPDSTTAAIDAAHEHFGRLDVVADSVGGTGVQPIFEATEDQWDLAMDLNLKSVWYVLRAAQKHMTRGGAMVTISSGAAEGRGPGMPYSIAKSALEKLSVGAAGTLADRGIRVNCVRVGMIWGAFAARGMTEEQREFRRQNVAMQTEGNNWDIAAAAFFLTTDQSRWITGQVLSVDGGGNKPQNTGSAGGTRPPKAN